MLNEHLLVTTHGEANSQNIVFWKDYRVTVLKNRLFRVEKNPNKQYRNSATLSVWYRNLPPVQFNSYEKEGKFYVETQQATLILSENREDCRVKLGNKLIKIDNEGNLKGTYRTLDCCDGEDFIQEVWIPDTFDGKVPLGVGVCSTNGVAYFNDANTLSFENGRAIAQRGEGSDEYVFAYGSDYKQAVKALYEITGSTPIIPRYALGNWWSRYHVYTDTEYLRLLNRFEERDIPFTVATIDMDWHYSNSAQIKQLFGKEVDETDMEIWESANPGWTGYSWNKQLFPDYKAFLNKIKQKNYKITLNLHPASGIQFYEDQYEQMADALGVDKNTKKRIKFDFTSDDFINNYFSILHKPYEQDGVQFWWIDWQQGSDSGMEGLDPLWALNHYHYLDNAKNNRNGLILSRYAGIGSHRTPLGFSGDTVISWKTLNFLPYFTSTASNVGYSWWSHDIGGHMGGYTDNELYLRFMQYGVFSPINRAHCSWQPTITKEPWAYTNGAGAISEEFYRLRHKLIPYLYTAANITAKEGEALVQPLYYNWNNPESYTYRNEYTFGSELLVAPITAPAAKDGYARVKGWLPKGVWTDIFTGKRYEVADKKGKRFTFMRTLESVPVFAKEGAILPLSLDKGNSCNNPQNLAIWVYEGNGSYQLYEDNQQQKEGEAVTNFTSNYSVNNGIATQTLRFIASGDEEVIPKNRKITVTFKEIPDGKVAVYKNGKKIKFEDCSSEHMAVNFKCVKDSEYLVKITYQAPDKLQRIKCFAQQVLTKAQYFNDYVHSVFEKVCKCLTVDQYVQIVSQTTLPKAVKEELFEIF